MHMETDPRMLDGASAAAPRRVDGRPILLLFAIAFASWTLTNMDQSMFGYAMSDLIKGFGLSIDQIGVMISVTFIAGIIGAGLGGIATDTWGVKRTLPVCLGVSALLVGLQGFANSAAIFGLLRIGSYAFSAALAPICNVLVANHYSAERRPMMVSILQCGYPFGWFIASFAAAPLIAHHGWRSPFLVAFAVAPVALLFYAALPRPPTAQTLVLSTAAERPLTVLARDHGRKAVLCTLIFFLYGGAAVGAVFYLPAFFQQVRGYNAATAAMIVGLSSGISTIGYIGSGFVCQTWLSRRTTAILWTLLGAVLLLAMIWLPHTPVQDVAMFSVAAIFFFGTASIITVYLLEIFPEEVRATASGVCGSGGLSAGSVLFPILVAHASTLLGWQAAFSWVIVPPLFLCVLLLLALPRRG